MAGDTEDLVLSISADVRQMQRALDRLVKDTDRSTKVVQQQFDAMGTRTAGAFDKVAANSNRVATSVQNDARRMATAMQASRFQTANLAAQLNDIGVQLASGTSPFQIALQQGTQINQILGAGGVRGAVSLLGASFASLINPVSLATIAIIGLGGAAIQYLTAMINSTDEVKLSLEEQAQLIQKVADRWGDALPAVRAYADELKRVAEEGDRQQAVAITIGKQFEEARAAIEKVGEASLFAFDVGTPAAEEFGRALYEAREAADQLERAQKAGGDTTEEFHRFQEALTALISSSAVPATGALRDAIDALGVAYRGAAQEAANLAAQNASLGGLPGRQGRLGNGLSDLDFARRFAGAGEVPGETGTPTTLPRTPKVAAPKMSDAEREAAAVKKLVDELEFEYSLLGKTDTERKIATELRRAGAAATDDQRARIEELVTAIDAEQAALKASEEAMKAVQDIGKDFLGGFIKDILAGKDASEALSNALGRVADKLLDLALNSLFSGGLFGKRGGLLGGLIIPGILHDGGVAGEDGYGHGRAVSPSVFKGARRYHSGGIAGLQPGEVPAILQRGEVVLPRGARSGAGGQQIVINAPINAPGADAAQLRRVEQSVRELGRNVPKIAVSAMKTTQTRKTRPA